MNKLIPYEDIDIELRELIKALNKIRGIRTTSCCFGHYKEPVTIYMEFKSIRVLNYFLWAGCWRYFNVAPYLFNSFWKLSIDNGDTSRNSKEISVCLHSISPKENTKYDQKIIHEIERLKKGLLEFHKNYHSTIYWFIRDLKSKIKIVIYRLFKNKSCSDELPENQEDSVELVQDVDENVYNEEI
jgi:hypothetical protein